MPSAKVTAIPFNSMMSDYFSYIHGRTFMSDESKNENSICKKLGIKENYANFVDKVSKYICAKKFHNLPGVLEEF